MRAQMKISLPGPSHLPASQGLQRWIQSLRPRRRVRDASALRACGETALGPDRHASPAPAAALLSAARALQFTRSCVASVACLAALGVAAAEPVDWPQRPVRLIVPAAAGGASDGMARMWADCMQPRLGQPVVIDNRPGAFGIPAIQALKQSARDGYTLLFLGMSNFAIAPYIHSRQPYFPEKDFEPVSLLTTVPYILVSGPRSRIASFGDISTMSKNTPAGLNFGSPGYGSVGHLMQAILAERMQARFMHVPYPSEAAGITSIAGDQIDLMLFAASTALPQAVSGRVKALVIFGHKRMPELPDVPTVGEVLNSPELAHGSWGAIVAKSGTRREIVDKAHELTRQCLQDPVFIKRAEAAKQVVVPGAVSDLTRYAERDTALWRPIIQKLGARVD